MEDMDYMKRIVLCVWVGGAGWNCRGGQG